MLRIVVAEEAGTQMWAHRGKTTHEVANKACGISPSCRRHAAAWRCAGKAKPPLKREGKVIILMKKHEHPGGMRSRPGSML
jgi:hypothetical protein